MKKYIYLIIIIIFSCTDSNFFPDKDCSGIIGGGAIIDDCGYCTGGNTKISFNQMLGCDSACEGSVYDIDNNCCPTYLWDCNGLCNGPDTLDCDGVCMGSALYYENEPFIDLNGSGTWEEGEVFEDINNNLEWDISTSCCYVDNCGGPPQVLKQS